MSCALTKNVIAERAERAACCSALGHSPSTDTSFQTGRCTFRPPWRSTRGATRRLLTTIVRILAALAAVSPVAAQEPTLPPPSQERVSLRLPLTVYASSAALDLYTTHQALQRPGFQEQNPVGAWLDEDPTTLVVFSAAADAAVVWSLHRWLGPRHSRLLRAGLYAAAGLRFWLAAQNAGAIRAHDRQRAGTR